MRDATITPPPLWEAVLQQAPAHLLLFDAALICRYAAPAHAEILGRPAPSLPGLPLAAILPGAGDPLRRPLLRALAGERWQGAVRTAAASAGDGWRQVTVTPLTLGTARLASLWISCSAVATEQARLQRELREGHAALRSGLAPICGYLQLIARRPRALGDAGAAEVISRRVLPALSRLTSAVDRLGEAARPAAGGHDHRSTDSEQGH